jgi:hypothetical protein
MVSARSERLSIFPATRDFAFAKTGIPTAATIATAIPIGEVSAA